MALLKSLDLFSEATSKSDLPLFIELLAKQHHASNRSHALNGYINDPLIPQQLTELVADFCSNSTHHGCDTYLSKSGRDLLFVKDKLDLVAQCSIILFYALKALMDGYKEVASQAVKYTDCDPGWISIFEGGAGPDVFRTAPNMSSYVYPLPQDSSSKTVIAIIGDWGTGMSQSYDMLDQIMGFNPNVVLHLGDVYYKGTFEEQYNYQVLPAVNTVMANGAQYFTIPGNHDYYYQNGAPFFEAIDNITAAAQGSQKQEASYFSLEGNHWVLIAMDTGVHDTNSFNESTDMTFLGPDQTAWAIDKIQNAKAAGKRVIFATHHQFFSQCEEVGIDPNGSYPAVNPKLYSELSSVIADMDIWFWGHEHSFEVFAPYSGLERGRMIGSAAITTPTMVTPSFPNPNLVPAAGESTLPHPLPGSPTEMPTASFAMYLQKQFAIMTLEGLSAIVDYYSVDWDCNIDDPSKTQPALGTCWWKPAVKIYSETLDSSDQ